MTVNREQLTRIAAGHKAAQHRRADAALASLQATGPARATFADVTNVLRLKLAALDLPETLRFLRQAAAERNRLARAGDELGRDAAARLIPTIVERLEELAPDETAAYYDGADPRELEDYIADARGIRL